jgi:hypothetical protein
MKYVFFLLLLVASSLRAETFSGYYVTQTSDTIHCSINLKKKHIDFYDFSRVTKIVTLVDNEGVKRFSPHEILCFAINIPDKGIYKFVSLEEDRKSFFHEIVNGKISLYKIYSLNSYDGALVIMPVALKDNKLIYLPAAYRKKRVSNLLEDNPAILEKWETTTFNAWTDPWFDTTEIEKYFKEYNEFDMNEK